MGRRVYSVIARETVFIRLFNKIIPNNYCIILSNRFQRKTRKCTTTTTTTSSPSRNDNSNTRLCGGSNKVVGDEEIRHSSVAGQRG
jgi:hypothetical protein